jgi:hypothetical protein
MKNQTETRTPMPKKLDAETKRLNMVVPAALARQIDEWRRAEPDIPNVSGAVRRLVEFALANYNPAKTTRALSSKAKRHLAAAE